MNHTVVGRNQCCVRTLDRLFAFFAAFVFLVAPSILFGAYKDDIPSHTTAETSDITPSSDFQDELNNANKFRYVLSAGTYDDDVVVNVRGSEDTSKPLVILADFESLGNKPLITAKITVNRPNVYLYGLYFDSAPPLLFNGGSGRSGGKVLRCYFMGSKGVSFQRDMEVAFNKFWNVDGIGFEFGFENMEETAFDGDDGAEPGWNPGDENWKSHDSGAFNAYVHHNYFRDWQGSGNGREAFRIGQGNHHRMWESRALVEFNLMENIDRVGENETISLKSSYNTVRYNTLVDCQNISSRLGYGNKIHSNYILRGSGISIKDGRKVNGVKVRNEVMGNYIKDASKGIHLFKGSANPDKVKYIWNKDKDGAIAIPSTYQSDIHSNQLTGWNQVSHVVSHYAVIANNVIDGSVIQIGRPSGSHWYEPTDTIIWGNEYVNPVPGDPNSGDRLIYSSETNSTPAATGSESTTPPTPNLPDQPDDFTNYPLPASPAKLLTDNDVGPTVYLENAPYGSALKFENQKSGSIRWVEVSSNVLEADNLTSQSGAAEFRIVDAGDGYGRFRLENLSGGYVKVDTSDNNKLKDNASAVGDASVFKWEAIDSDTVAIVWCDFVGGNDLYVFPDPSGKFLKALGTSLGSEDKYDYVASANTAPVANDDSDFTLENIALDIDVLSNDSDAESDPLTPSIVSQGSKGTASVNGSGTINYSPNSGVFGTDSFVYRVNDGSVNSNQATVTVVINEDVALLPYEGFTPLWVMANENDGQDNSAANVMDSDFTSNSYWAGSNAGGNPSLHFDLGSDKSVDKVSIAYLNSDTRQYNITIDVMASGASSWTQVFSGSSSLFTGGTGVYDVYSFSSQTAQFVRITGNGYTTSSGSGPWTSISEVAIDGTVVDTIFDDGYTSGWGNGGWSCSWNSSYSNGGDTEIEVVYSSGGNYTPQHYSGPLSVSSNDKIAFYARSSSGSINMRLKVRQTTGGATTGNEAFTVTSSGGNFEIPLTDLGSVSAIHKLVFAIDGGTGTVYFDDIRILD